MGMQAYQTAYHLSLLGWQLHLLTPQNYASDEEIAQFNARQPFAIERWHYRGSFVQESLHRFRTAWHKIKEFQPDLILAIGEKPVWLGAILSKLTRKPLVAIGCGTEFRRGGRVYRWMTRWSFDQSRHNVAISQFTRQLMGQLGIDLGRVSVIPCGADEALYGQPVGENPWRTLLGLEGAQVILTVGQLSPRKAQDVVIRAMPALLQHHPHVHYLLVGLPTAQSELEQLATHLGVREHVHFLGHVPQSQLPFLYNLADLFVLVSRQTAQGDVEGYGIVVNEAGLCGVPAVVADQSGLVEAILPNITGLVVPPENPSATAEAIIKLLDDPVLCRQMGEAARHYAQEQASWQKRIAQYDQLLHQLLKEKG